MTTYYRYRLKCTTESADKYWILKSDDPVPSTCPTNTAHTIDSASITIIETMTSSIVKIKEESIETGGNFLAQTVDISATGPTGTVTPTEVSWPIPVSALEIQFESTTENQGDMINICVGPNTIIGILIANCATGATSIDVSQTVIDNTMVGYYLKLYDGTNTNDCGRVLAIDKENNKVTLETVPTNSFLAATPTYIQQNVFTAKDFKIGPPHKYVIGEGKIGGSYIPAGIKVRVDYTNNGNTTKTLTPQLELLY